MGNEWLCRNVGKLPIYAAYPRQAKTSCVFSSTYVYSKRISLRQTSNASWLRHAHDCHVCATDSRTCRQMLAQQSNTTFNKAPVTDFQVLTRGQTLRRWGTGAALGQESAAKTHKLHCRSWAQSSESRSLATSRRTPNLSSTAVHYYSRTRLKRHRFMRHLVYNVRYSVVPINLSLLTITLHSSVITTSVYTTPRL
jgi:hypothetical protein